VKAKRVTQHTCNSGHGPVFGRKTAGCLRCDELLAGAKPISWNIRDKKAEERDRSTAIHIHFTSEKHLSGGCGPVCTYGDW